MKKRGPKSEGSLRTEWSLICTMIARNANFSATVAEQYFGIGRASGRTWRYWVSGERLARGWQRDFIIKKALADGLLNAASIAIIKKTSAGADVSMLPDLTVPPMPSPSEVSPDEAAIELWQWIRKRKVSRFMTFLLRLNRLEEEWKQIAELTEKVIADANIDDDTIALAWIKRAYRDQATRSNRNPAAES